MIAIMDVSEDRPTSIAHDNPNNPKWLEKIFNKIIDAFSKPMAMLAKSLPVHHRLPGLICLSMDFLVLIMTYFFRELFSANHIIQIFLIIGLFNFGIFYFCYRGK